MDSLFSTIAQISFTLLGLIVVALTIDTKSRKFWFGETHRRRYAFSLLLYALLPGLVALGGLVPSLDAGIPSWLLLSIFLLFLYLFRYFVLHKIIKSPEFLDLLIYEEKLETLKTARTSLILLTLLVLVGILTLGQSVLLTNFLLGFFLFTFTAISFAPISIILGISFESKSKTKTTSSEDVKIEKQVLPTPIYTAVKRKKRAGRQLKK